MAYESGFDGVDQEVSHGCEEGVFVADDGVVEAFGEEDAVSSDVCVDASCDEGLKVAHEEGEVEGLGS